MSNLSPHDDIFVLAREDLGIILLTLDYAEHWAKTRKPPYFFVISPSFLVAKTLAKYIAPNVNVICYNTPFSRWIYRNINGQVTLKYYTEKLLDTLKNLKRNILYLLDYQSLPISPNRISSYHRDLDPVTTQKSYFSKPFLKAYESYHSYYFFRKDTWRDYFHLYSKIPISDRKPLLKERYEKLLKTFSISRPFVVLQLNCKYYGNPNDCKLNARRIIHPSRFNAAIDLLIEKGYTVILQGRGEQPLFSERDHFIDYAHSTHISLENDLTLYGYAKFAICSKTGPDGISQVYNTPLLGVNYVEPTTLLPHKKHRFYFKEIFDEKQGKFLNWKECLTHPSFFNYASYRFDDQVSYHEMTEEDILHALLEFLPLLDKTAEEWTSYTPLQKSFKSLLSERHFDLFHVPGVPCNTYLEKTR